MSKVIKLSDTELNATKITVLKYLVDNNKPVLIEVPVNMNVWGIDRKLELLLEEEAYANEVQKTHLKLKQGDFVNNTEICATQLMQNTSFIRLSSIDLPVLLKNSRCSIKESNSIVYFNSEGDVKEQSFIDGRSYFSVRNNPENTSYTNFVEAVLDLGMRSSVSISKRWNNIKFVFTNNSVNKSKGFDFPRGELRSLNVELNSIHVFDKDIQKFIIESLDLIPEGSPYYIPKELRRESDLDKLAELGYKTFGLTNDDKLKSKELVSLIVKELGYLQRKAESASFFLNPNPKGKKGKDTSIANDCQFPYLTHTLESHWKSIITNKKETNTNSCTDKKKAEIKTKAKTDKRNAIEKVTSFLEVSGFSLDNAKYGEIMLRPKKL
jgi:hypothetical protein